MNKNLLKGIITSGTVLVDMGAVLTENLDMCSITSAIKPIVIGATAVSNIVDAKRSGCEVDTLDKVALASSICTAVEIGYYIANPVSHPLAGSIVRANDFVSNTAGILYGINGVKDIQP